MLGIARPGRAAAPSSSWCRRASAAGSSPTGSPSTATASIAVALSILDAKAPALLSPADPREDHWCPAHYPLDGHREVEAAATGGRPLSLVSLLSRGRGVSSGAEVRMVLRALGEARP
jgi:hypothetical protein